jgi:hypothetical protein
METHFETVTMKKIKEELRKASKIIRLATFKLLKYPSILATVCICYQFLTIQNSKVMTKLDASSRVDDYLQRFAASNKNLSINTSRHFAIAMPISVPRNESNGKYIYNSTKFNVFRDNSLSHLEDPISDIHCIGETFNESRKYSPAALYRSCKYTNLCYDVQQKEFVLFPSEDHKTLVSNLHSNIFLATVSKPVMVSEVVHLFPENTAQLFPKYQEKSQTGRYYSTDGGRKDVTWVPIHPPSCKSMLWDVFLPVYTLLELFDLHEKPYQILLFEGSKKCSTQKIENFIQMFGTHSTKDTPPIVSLVTDWKLPQRNHDESPQSMHRDYVCLPQSVMGLGSYGDHQAFRTAHLGEDNQKKRTPPSHLRRASNLRGFRNAWIQKWKLLPSRRVPITIAYSTLLPPSLFPAIFANITGIESIPWPSKSSLREKIQIATYLSILVLSSQEEKTAAFFLPEGATLILLGKPNDDWDLLSNNSQLRVHLLGGRPNQALEFIINEEILRLNLDKNLSYTKPEEEEKLFLNNQSVSFIRGSPPITNVHCVGEKLFPNRLGSEWYRSCHYQNLCFDLQNKVFVAHMSPQARKLMSSHSFLYHKLNYISSIPRKMVVSPQLNRLGGGYPFYADLPEVYDLSNVSSYYRYNGTWLSTKIYNSDNSGTLGKLLQMRLSSFSHISLFFITNYLKKGHVLWDIWLPIFSLLELFALNKHELIVTLFPSINIVRPVYSFLAQSFGLVTPLNPNESLNVSDSRSRYICALNGGSGYGWLMDHGFGDHGWKPDDLMYPVNLRRGPELWRLRNFILRNLDIPAELQPNSKIEIVFSISSSHDWHRRIQFQEEYDEIKRLNLSNQKYRVRKSHLVAASLRKQLMIASRTTIFISVVGGGTFPAFFLPKGSTLILYGDRDLYLDFDIFNNCGYLRVHWMSLNSRLNDTSIFLDLIRDELAAHERAKLHP